mmetsp:Transcript_69662/g.123328  ORF Transcript_69662/g.123328 Transcript_69662/m.123328 type:complete len:220 (+) Transcript_69662:62-721(+)
MAKKSQVAKKPIVQKKPRGKPDERCIAFCLNGRCCTRKIDRPWSSRVTAAPVPYCRHHAKHGDGAVRVASHPVCGKILVARHRLPKGYRIVYHGARRTSGRDDDKVDWDEDRTLWFYPEGREEGRSNGYIDPTSHKGSVLQFAACVGPGELVNIRQSGRGYGRRDGDYAGMEYVTTMPVPAGTQLVHYYGSEWWRDRPELRRCDVGTEKYPAPKRKTRA